MGDHTKLEHMAHQFGGFKATKPAVCLKDADKCYYEVYFDIYDSSGTKSTYRTSKGINTERLSERKAQAMAMADVLWEALNKEGWNPLETKYPYFPKAAGKPEIMDFCQALEYGLKGKTPQLSEYSIPDYRGCVRFIAKAAIECGLSRTKINMIERKDIRRIIATAKEQNSWSNNARNKYLNLLKSLLTVLVDDELLPFNPAHKIKDEFVPAAPSKERITDAEKEIIANHLLQTVPDYFEYLMCIYHDGIRRKETLMLKVQDVNFSKREILIRPEVAKTNTARKVPIIDDLLDIFIRREIWTLPPDWYIFSSNKFAPGPEMYHPNTPTSWWHKKVVKELGINKQMYWLKHRGADDKILAGINPLALKKMYGHKSLLMTEVYAEEIKELYKRQIIEGAPHFAKVVEMKKRAQ